MFSADCPCCHKLIDSGSASTAEKGDSLGHFFCPFCKHEIVWAKKSQLWLIPTLFVLPVCIICAAIDGNSRIDSVVEYASIGVSVLGFIGICVTYQYEEVRRDSDKKK